MREIYSSPRPENIDRVVALFAEHGIETRITNRAVYDRPSYTHFSYAPGADRSDWARVEVKYAKDLTRARALLRDVGVAPMIRFSEELELSRQPRRWRTRRAIVGRARTISMALLVAAVIFLFAKMTGIV